MKAAVWYGVKDVRIEKRDLRKMGEHELKIKIAWTGICGSDLHEYEAGPVFIPVDKPDPLSGATAPISLGHEFSGIVEETGSKVTNFKSGDRVSIYPLYTSGEYVEKEDMFNGFACLGLHLDGGFADYCIVSASMAYKIPDTMSLEEGALVEPAAVAIQAVKESNLTIGDTVAVFGSGPIGLLTIMAAKSAGATTIIALDVSETRLQMAKEVGATHVINSTKVDPVGEIRNICPGGVDIAYEVAGIEITYKQAIRATKIRGVVMIISIFAGDISVNPIELTLSGVRVMASLTYEPKTFAQTIDLIASGQFNAKQIITKRIEFNEIVKEGFESLSTDKSQAKILVKLSGEQ
jgi:(R,R)-butanediol dehydrogenase/meso-butanediol dehydrogenase/diacetyl reductase